MLQCKEKMRPVKRALKMLENPEENTSEKDQVTQTKQVKKKISILSILLERSISRRSLESGVPFPNSG